MKCYRAFSSLFLSSFLLFALNGCDNLFVQKGSCGFSFDMRYDNQHATVVDYKLQGANNLIAFISKENLSKGDKFYGAGIGLQYDRPTSLYVKWHDDVSGSVYEKTIDLKNVMPRDLDGTMLYFILHESQIFVYLAYLNKDGRNQTKIGSTIYSGYLNIQLYPNIAAPP